MKTPLNFNQIRRLVRWPACVLGVILLLALVSWLVIPGYLKNTLEQQVANQMGRSLTIDRVEFNPFTLTVGLSGLVLYESDKKTRDFSAEELLIKISPVSLFRLAPVVREMVLKKPVLMLVRTQRDGQEKNNFSDVIQRIATQPKPDEPLRFSISNIQLIDGGIHVDDQVVGKKIDIKSLNIGVPFLSNFSSATDTFIEPGLSANVDGSVFELRGRSKPFSDTYETSLAIHFNGLDLVPLLAFSPKPLPFKVNSARLSSQLSLNFIMKKNSANMTLSGGATLSDVALSDFSDAPLFKTKLIHVSLQEANLTTEKMALNLVEIDEPQLWAGLNNQGKLNWLAGLHTDTAKTSSALSKNKPVLDLAHFKLKNGTVHWSDAANGTPAMAMTLNKLNIDVQKISTDEKAAPGKLNINFEGDHQQQASFVGVMDPAHERVSGQLALSDFALSDFQPYFNRYLTANASGKLSLKTQLAVLNGHIQLSEFSGALEELVLHTNQNKNQNKTKPSDSGLSGGSSDIVAKRIAIENASVNSELKQAIIEKLVLDRLQGDVFRDVDGSVNLIRFLKKESNAANATVTDKEKSSTKEAKWLAEINQISLVNGNFLFSDKSKKPEVTIRADHLEAHLEKVSSNLDRPFTMKVRANLNSKGKMAVEGVVAQKSAQLKVNLQNCSVVVLQPYFTDFLNITLEKGRASINGQLDWSAPKELSYKGTLLLLNFSSSDKETSDSFLRWKTLNIAGIDASFGAKQQKITLGKIDVSDFYARAILSEQGRLNLDNILVHEHAGSPVTAGTNVATSKEVAQINATKNVVQSAIAVAQKNTENLPVTVVNIEQVNLNNGIVNYTDNFIKPHFSMRMTGMKGTIGKIRSTEPKPAPINLNGKIDNDAPIVISGSLNPLFKPILLDIKMTATGIDLPRLTAYSAKYAGYPIEKGKLSLDVEYHVKDNKLSANNTLKIDQLTFGKKVDSPDATKLPVLFVVDLLADRNGRINLDVPISGTLDDPEFSVGSMFMRVFLNLIGKVITSPFSLLAHSISGAGELSYVEFDSGSAKLTDAIKAKLDSLAKALEERPDLKLDIIGRADLAGDMPGLREGKLNRQIRKIRNMDRVDGEEESGNAQNNGPVSGKDRESAIWKIYSNTKFDKPRNLIGLAKVLPVGEMEKAIRENTPVSEDDLITLATRRAAAVRTYLTDTAHVPSERMYTIAPKISGAGTDTKNADKSSLTRVDFDLKM